MQDRLLPDDQITDDEQGCCLPSSSFGDVLVGHISVRVPRVKTTVRGSNDQEYQIYATNAEDLGWPVKSYDEWLMGAHNE